MLAVLPYIFTSGTALTTMSYIGIMIVFALSYNVLFGLTGLLSFGHAVYYGLGGFMAIHAMNIVTRHQLPIPVVLIPLVGGLGGLLFGIIFGSVSTRRGGTTFAMISLGLGELIASSSLILRGFFGGEEGITANRAKLLRLFDWSFGPQIQVYYLIAAWCLLCMLAVYGFTRTPLGQMCRAVRDNPERAEFVGYSTVMVRFLAFCVAGFFAGVAGGLAAINFEIMNASSVGAGQSGLVLFMTYVGGAGHFIGPILGAIVIGYLQIMLSDLTEIWQFYFGLIFMLAVMYAPAGLAGLLLMHRPLWRARTWPRVVPAYLLALVPLLITLLGASLTIEMTFRLTVKASDGPNMIFFYTQVNAASAVSWMAAVVLSAGGFLLFRRTWPVVARAWHEALAGAAR